MSRRFCGLLCSVALLLGLSVQSYAYNSFVVSDGEPCSGGDVLVKATWCPPPSEWDPQWAPPPPNITVPPDGPSGGPSPFLIPVASGMTTDGGWWLYRAGPNPGRLQITSQSGDPQHAPRVYSTSITIRGGEDGGGCATCGGGGGNLGTERVSIADGPSVEFAVGSIKEYTQSPVRDVRLVLGTRTPVATLGDPNSLQITGLPLWDETSDWICDQRDDPDACFPWDTCGVLSVNTGGGPSDSAASTAVVHRSSATEYSIRLYGCWASQVCAEPCVAPNSSCCVDPDRVPLLTWHVSSPDCNDLVITRTGPTDEIEVQYNIQCTDGNHSWQVTTGDGSVDYRREAVVWAFDQQTSEYRRDHTVELRSSAGVWYTQSKRSTWHASVDDPWTTEVVDPDGPNPQVTTREFYDATAGQYAGTVKWQVNADGSWEWNTLQTSFSATGGTVRVNRGWKDDARPTSPTGWGTYTETTYEPKVDRIDNGWQVAAGLTVGLEEIRVQNNLIRKFASDVDDDEEDVRFERRYWAPSDPDYLVTMLEFFNFTPYGSNGAAPFPPFPAECWLWDVMVQPNGVRTERTFSTRSAGLEESSWEARLYATAAGRTIERTQNCPGSSSIESFDRAGKRTLVGSRWSTDATLYGRPTEWTYFEYDGRGRLTRECFSDRTQRTTTWADCCRTRTVTDRDGVRTQYAQDLAGRPVLEVREIGAQKRAITQYVYSAETYESRALPTVTVLHGYDEQAFEQPVGTFTVLRRTQTISDLAGRVVAEIVLDESSNELLKTTYAYGSTAEGGRQVTTTRPDGETEIRAYYCDGQLKSVTGTGVVPTYYVYSAAQGSLTTTVYTGSNPSSRYVTTTRDMLGRVITEQRPGWSATGTETLTTTYFYNESTGDLEKVETRDSSAALVAAPQLYEYERSATELVQRSGIEPNAPYDEVLDTSGDDRYTEVTESSETAGGLTYRVKTTRAVEDGGTERVLSVEKKLVYGLGVVDNPDGTGWKVIGYRKMQDERGDEITQTTTLSDTTPTRKTHTEHSDWTNTAVETWAYGRGATAISRTGVTRTYEYDALGRETSVGDGRTVTHTDYDALGRVWKLRDAANRTTEYLYHLQGESGAGQVKQVIDALGKDTYYAYDELGRLEYTWGDTPQPTWIEYTPYGERWKLHTYRSPDTGWDGASWPSVGNGDVTTWTYNDATGLLEQKMYADDTAVDYEYTANGQLAARLWARTASGQRVTATYGYDPRTSELLTTTYNDGTPGVTMTYDRRGRLNTVAQSGSSGLNYDYDYSQWPTSVSVTTSGLYAKTVTQTYDAAKGGQLTQQTVTGEYTANYFYNAATGRLERATGPGLPDGTGTPGAHYGYVTGSDLVASIGFKNSAGTTLLSSVRTFESYRDIVATVTHTWNQGTPTTISLYDYRDPVNQSVAADDLGRRADLAYSGVAFPAALTRDFGYNSRNELTSAVQTGGLSGDSWSYAYDPIGNRATMTTDGSVETAYTSNALNEYDRWDRPTGTLARQGYTYDADGNLTASWLVGDMNGNGVAGMEDVNPFADAGTMDPNAWCEKYSDPNRVAHTLPCENYWYGDINGDGAVSVADVNPFVAILMAGGNAGVARTYIWDAENRLVRVEPAGTIQPTNLKVEFAYDYQGRRTEKKVYSRDPNNTAWELTGHRTYLWSGWLLLAEYDALNSGAVVRKYTWGLDLAGLNGSVNGRESAGGIGGLLAVDQAAEGGGAASGGVDAGTYVFTYDANGNVGQVVDLSAGSAAAALVARYEYDPYGNVVGPDTNNDGVFDASDTPGWYTTENPWRFSTKQFDDETELGYWGYRYYSPGLGRWISRDPIGEPGANNLYGYASNDASNFFDSLGQMASSDDSSSCDDCPLPPPKVPGDCSDCWDTCTSEAGQKMVSSAGGMVICRPDGCSCACVNLENNKNYTTSDGRAIGLACALQHEEQHVGESKQPSPITEDCHDLYKPCYPVGFNKRFSNDPKSECPGYGVEAQCLDAGLDSCKTAECRTQIELRLIQVIEQMCQKRGCPVRNYAASMSTRLEGYVQQHCPKNMR